MASKFIGFIFLAFYELILIIMSRTVTNERFKYTLLHLIGECTIAVLVLIALGA